MQSRFCKIFVLQVFILSGVSLLKGQSSLDQSNYDVFFYGLDIHLTNLNTDIEGKCRIGLSIIKPYDTLKINFGNNLKAGKIHVNGNKVKFKHKNSVLSIPVSDWTVGDDIYVDVWYYGNAGSQKDAKALYNKANRYGRFTYSLTEPYSAKYLYPCKEVLTDKADSVYVFVTAPKKLKVGAPGVLTEIISVDRKNDKYCWKSRYPTAYYLVSVALGKYTEYISSVKLPGVDTEMPVVNYIYDSDQYFEYNKDEIDATNELLRIFSEKFGTYPFYKEKYGHCVVPYGGGMEHQTMTTIGYFDTELVAHELAHQWFGNFVTCDKWNDIWVNEGFASYSEYIAYQELGMDSKARAWLDYAMQLTKEYYHGSVYVPDKDLDKSDRIFDYRLSYKKGAVILHMIRYELNNDELFFKILREFLLEHSFGNASANDFKLHLENLSGKEFDTFFEEWYFGHGYPLLKVQWKQVKDTLYIENNQSTTAPEETSFFHLNLQYKISTTTSDTTIIHKVQTDSDTLKVLIPDKVKKVEVDPGRNLLIEVLDVNKHIE